jgi:agmatine deiminase
MSRPTPAALGYVMPPEWHPHAATWLSWPKDPLTWPDRVPQVETIFLRMIEVLAEHETVNVLVDDESTRDQVRARMPWPQARNVQLHVIPTVDSWIRDYGPNFLLARPEKRQAGGPLAHNALAYNAWGFNAWGGKYEALMRDASVPRAVAPILRVPVFEPGLVLEGGSIDVNGRGLLLTSEQCLLNKNRNPHLTRAQIEQNLRDFLGVKTILWVGDGILGDDTDGHIDDITRFFKADGFITAVESNRRDPNHRILEENLERLRGFRTPAGKKFDLVTLPMPKPFAFEGQRVPASYANFLIINGAVLVPTFRQKKRDAEACAIIGGCFPGREVIPIDCYHLIWGLGTLHCISQQQPA